MAPKIDSAPNQAIFVAATFNNKKRNVGAQSAKLVSQSRKKINAFLRRRVYESYVGSCITRRETTFDA
jgi:hypothetical protein